MSELLDRIEREIRERLEATRAAVLEHERLEAALHALGDAGSRATRAVRGRGRGSGTDGSAQRSSADANRAGARAPVGKRRSAAGGTAKRAVGGASASARRSSGASAGGDGERMRASAGGRAASVPAKKQRRARAAAGTPARGRAPRGANRAAVLRVIGERPSVTARELADASQVTGGTLYSLLRRLADDGTVEKRELPGGQTGYALARSLAPEPSAAARPQTATADGTGVESLATAGPVRDRADSTEIADPARSTATEAQSSQAPANQTADADETPIPRSDR